MRDNHSNDNNNYYKLFEALKLIRIIYTVLMHNRSCFTRKQTCNGEYMKHCTRSRHQLKMSSPAEVSEKRSNFRIRQFEEKRLFNIAANLTLNTMASFVILLIACTARIMCSDRHTDIHTHTRDNYCNPLCACATRVNNTNRQCYQLIIVQLLQIVASRHITYVYRQ